MVVSPCFLGVKYTSLGFCWVCWFWEWNLCMDLRDFSNGVLTQRRLGWIISCGSLSSRSTPSATLNDGYKNMKRAVCLRHGEGCWKRGTAKQVIARARRSVNPKSRVIRFMEVVSN